MGGSNGAPLWNKSRWIAQNAVAPGTHSDAKLAYADTVTQYDSDELTNLELGYKGTLADGKVDLTAAIYQQDIDDVAIYVSDYALDAVGGIYIANAGEASSDGYELAIRFFANYSTVGDRFADSANLYALEEYSVTNLRYTLDSNDGWRAALFVNNANDETYVTFVDDVSYGFGTLGRQYGRPMEMGVNLVWDFN